MLDGGTETEGEGQEAHLAMAPNDRPPLGQRLTQLNSTGRDDAAGFVVRIIYLI
jgi:hypothetical protein